jgi:signal transduction histidine kinase
VLADLTARLASAESTDGLLERMVQRLSEGTGADRAIVRLVGDEKPAAVWPPDADDWPDDGAFTVPITVSEVELGSVSVVKGRGEALTPTERALVVDLAGSAGMVLNKVRLDADLAARADELRSSRRRLVDAQAEERRRLERDLHDGAQQQVVALKVKLGLAERFAEQEGSESSAGLIRQMATDAQEALEEIRSLGKGIFPPLLESDGLRAAVSAGAANAPVPVIVAAPDLGRYDTEIEAAAYFCITEAITNAIKYSGSERIEVQLGNGTGGLEFEVTDQGEGFDPAEHQEGSGLVGMRDRLEALGGTLSVRSSPGTGTQIVGFVPADASH